MADKQGRGPLAMQITVDISEEILRAAEARGLSVADFVESLLAGSVEVRPNSQAVSSAMERIRTLRSVASAAKR
jgi:uncharacterized protein (DUF1778 family)